MTTQMYICLALFILLIAGYVFSSKLRISTGVIALCATLLTVWLKLLPAKAVLSNFSNSNVLLIAGMFIVSAGFNRTQAVNKVSEALHNISGGNFTIVLAGYLAVSFLLGSLLPSAVAAIAITAPLLAASCYKANVSPSKVMFSLGLVAISAMGVLPIGGAVTQFATQNGYLKSYGYMEYQMQLIDPFKGRFIGALIVAIYALLIGPKLAPAQPSVPIADDEKSKGGPKKEPLDPVREVLGYSLFILTTIGLMFASKLGLEEWQVAMTGAALVTVTGVISPKEATKAIPFRVLLMLIAALTVGSAMVECGLGDLIGDSIASAMGGTRNGYIIGAVFFVIPFLLTQVMQNRSVKNIFTPIVIMTCKSLGCNPIGPLLLLASACQAGYLTPNASATVPLIMSVGGYDQKDLFKMGWLPALIMSVASVVVIMSIFPTY